MWTWEMLLSLAAVLGLVAAVVEIVRGRRNISIALLALVVILTIVAGSLIVENARVSARNAALTDVQQRAQHLVQVLSGGSLDTSFNSIGENRGIVVAVADFLLDFRTCRPEAYDRLSRVFDEAMREAEGLPDYDASLPRDASDVWESAAETAFEQVRAIAEVSPRCG
jgi:hypothetical protein